MICKSGIHPKYAHIYLNVKMYANDNGALHFTSKLNENENENEKLNLNEQRICFYLLII